MPAQTGRADTFHVFDEASFVLAFAQAQAGDVIEFAPGRYPELRARDRSFSRTLELVGPRSAELFGIDFAGSSNIRLSGVTIAPPGSGKAHVWMGGADEITLDDVLVDGRDQSLGAVVRAGGRSITISNSEFTNCGQNDTCIRPGASDLTIVDNYFHDCRSCTFIKGGGEGATIRGNVFERTTPGDCRGGPEVCPHNNMIFVFGGGPWTISGNRFGDVDLAAGQIHVNPGKLNRVHDVRIESNIFTGDLLHGIRVGVGDRGRSDVGPPRRVEIVNNTILSGRAGSVELTAGWLDEPESDRPLVANNILLEGQDCNRGRYRSNLAITGSGCDTGEEGPANLDEDGEPTRRSRLVIDRADPAFAPNTDFYGRPRVGEPDRGAFEYIR